MGSCPRSFQACFAFKASLPRWLEPQGVATAIRKLLRKLPTYHEVAGKLPTTRINILSYNQGLNLRLNHVLMGYVRDIIPPFKQRVPRVDVLPNGGKEIDISTWETRGYKIRIG